MEKKLKITENQLKMLVSNKLTEESKNDVDEAARAKFEKRPKDSEMKHFDKNGKELKSRPRVDGGYSVDKDGKKYEYKSEKNNEIEESQEFGENMNGLDQESQMNELGGSMYKNREGGFEHGHGPDNDPEHMAELVISKMDMFINPEYLKNPDLFNEFMSSLTSKIRERFESRSEFPESPSEEETINNQIYESIKNNFKRFL